MKNRKIIWIIFAVIIIAISILPIKQFIEKKNNESLLEKEKEQPNVEIVEKKEATYEQWLAAAMVVAVSLEGEPFNVKHIYLCSENTLDNKQNSDGVYLIYEKEKNMICLHSSPLKEECKEKGMKNLYTQDLGFATFNNVDINTQDFSNYEEIVLEDLEELISQSMLVSIYEN